MHHLYYSVLPFWDEAERLTAWYGWIVLSVLLALTVLAAGTARQRIFKTMLTLTMLLVIAVAFDWADGFAIRAGWRFHFPTAAPHAPASRSAKGRFTV